MSWYRHHANKLTAYHVKLRDRDIEGIGLRTVIRRPEEKEHNANKYGDPIVTYGPKEYIYIVPHWDQWYQIIDVLGQNIEFDLPLKATVKITDFIPTESVILLSARNNEGSLESRWWVVNSTSVQHLESQYSRTAYLSPHRDPVHEDNSGAVHIHSGSLVSVNGMDPGVLISSQSEVISNAA